MKVDAGHVSLLNTLASLSDTCRLPERPAGERRENHGAKIEHNPICVPGFACSALAILDGASRFDWVTIHPTTLCRCALMTNRPMIFTNQVMTSRAKWSFGVAIRARLALSLLGRSSAKNYLPMRLFLRVCPRESASVAT
jgi:hypothetical protein